MTPSAGRGRPSTPTSRLFDWNGDGLADHTELVTAWHDGTLYTIGGNSGPSNVDGYRGQGGVHRHAWTAPAGQGNPEVLMVVNTAKAVTFGSPAVLHQPGQPSGPPRMLMLKSPVMAGADVSAVQRALNKLAKARLAADGQYGPLTRGAVMAWQAEDGLQPDGIVGARTRASLGLAGKKAA